MSTSKWRTWKPKTTEKLIGDLSGIDLSGIELVMNTKDAYRARVVELESLLREAVSIMRIARRDYYGAGKSLLWEFLEKDAIHTLPSATTVYLKKTKQSHKRSNRE